MVSLIAFSSSLFLLFFFFNDTPTTDIYTLSLHDALPISRHHQLALLPRDGLPVLAGLGEEKQHRPAQGSAQLRSEEHTSELQSHSDLVCRLLLEKKNKKIKRLETIDVNNHETEYYLHRRQ